jgi:hypothetical protein
MKNLLLLTGLLCIVSCHNNSSKEKKYEDTLDEGEVELSPQEKLPWITDYDTVKAEFFLKQQRKINPDSLTTDEIVSNINAAWENVKLEFRKISHDTIYVAIPQSEFLTERMGSSGAAEYLASTTYNLTELKNIKFVNYDFEAGDHLNPGTYGRSDFKDFK